MSDSPQEINPGIACEIICQTDLSDDWVPWTQQPIPYGIAKHIAHVLAGNMNVRSVKIIRIEMNKVEMVIKSPYHEGQTLQ